MPSKEYLAFHEFMLKARKQSKEYNLEKERAGVKNIPNAGRCVEGVSFSNYKINGVEVEHYTRLRNPITDSVIVHIHGGAFCTGSPYCTRNSSTQICLETGYEIISIDYRLAPENKFPAGLNDCFDVFTEVSKKYKNVYLLGESAGGNLSLTLLHKLIDNNETLPKKVALLSPTTFFDSEGGTHTSRVNRDPMCGVPNYTTSKISLYVEEGVDVRHKYISPLYGDLSKFPELLIIVGTEELLFDDSVLLYSKAVMSKVKAELVVGEGYMHIFPTMFSEFNEVKPYLDKVINYFIKG